ncbi:GNAT family N-acetyltransferase [Cloacibacillus porcorum]|uniref:GNAT family N-acetyltransferase n=1 Tax=Cloacibacillus porcorum TaxID=1197717 RepID=UPI003F029250
MLIKKILPAERERALTLALDVFMQYEAHDYPKEGIETFRRFLSDTEKIGTLEMYGSYEGDELTGMIAMGNEGEHVTLFFVDGKHQRRGVGRKLFEAAIGESSSETITVNSSAFAVGIYRRLGFTADCGEQISDGLRYTPMTYRR